MAKRILSIRKREMKATEYPMQRSIISLMDLTVDQIEELGDIALRYSDDPGSFSGRLEGVRIGLIFTAPSTRTRTAFWSAAQVLGCRTLQVGPLDLQLTTGENWSDTGAMLAHYLHCAVVRTNGPQHEIRDLAQRLPATINALTYEEHPTQAIADLCALRERFGRTEQIRIAYLGQINNTARSLAMLVGKTENMSLDIYAPEGLGLPDQELENINSSAGRQAITQRTSLPALPPHTDVIYTTRWESMGVPHESPDWLSQFEPFAVTPRTMRLFGRESEPLFMHDLPAVRGQEVTSEILDGPHSLVQRQAFHKASAAAASLLWVLGAAG